MLIVTTVSTNLADGHNICDPELPHLRLVQYSQWFEDSG